MQKLLWILLFASCQTAIAQLSQIPWAMNINTMGGFDHCYNITSDNQGFIYAAGRFDSEIDIDPGPGITWLEHGWITNGAYVTKIGNDGVISWIKPIYAPNWIVGSAGVDPKDIKVNDQSEVFLVGDFGASSGSVLNFDHSYSDTTITGSGGFLIKLDQSSELIWFKRWDHEISSVDLYSNGDMLVTGVFSGSIDLDPGPGTQLSSSNGLSGFAVKLDLNGNFVWGKTFAEGGNIGYSPFSQGTAINGLDEAFITSRFHNTIQFNTVQSPVDLVSQGVEDFFVCKLNSSGDIEWCRRIGGDGEDISHALATMGDDKIVISGHFSDTVEFSPGNSQGTLISAGVTASARDAFTLCLNTDGTFEWVRQMGGQYHDYGFGIAVDPMMNVFMTGVYNFLTDLDPGSGQAQYTSISGEDAFVVKFDLNGNYLESTSIGGTSHEKLFGICSDPHGNIYASGKQGQGIQFAPSYGIPNLLDLDGAQGFIIRFGGQTNIEQLKQDQLSVFPNPFENVITVELENDQRLDITLFDLLGKKVAEYSDYKSGSLHTLNTKNLPAGEYILKCESEQNVWIRKVMKPLSTSH